MANEVRLIDANALTARWKAAMLHMVKEADGRHPISMEVLLEDVQKAQTIEPESLRPKGRWECIKEQCNESPVYKFSECSQEVEIHDGRNIQKTLKYCPHCGAKMEE